MPTTSKNSRGIKEGYRSGLEDKVSSELKADGRVAWGYETTRIKYKAPDRSYTPDFILEGSNKKVMYIETKGRFLGSNRSKHLLIQKQYPNIDLRFVFSNPNQKLYKGSKTTYGEWCRKHGFQYSTKSIPTTWIEELIK